MKKLLAGTLIAASVLCIGGTGVLAAAPGRGQNFIDSDGNGICDHLETSLTDGIRGGGMNFTDEDGDGICDNYGIGNAGTGNAGTGNAGAGNAGTGNTGTGNCVGRQEGTGGTGRHAGNGCHAGFRGGRNR